MFMKMGHDLLAFDGPSIQTSPQRYVVNAVKEIDVGNNPTRELGTPTEERANNHKRGQTYETQIIISTDKGSY